MKSRRFLPYLVVGFSVLAYLLLSGCYIQMGGCRQADYRQTVNRQVVCAAGNTLDVATPFGAITITGADTNECSVRAEIVARAPTEEEARELAEQVEIKTDTNGDTVKIRADQPHLANNRSITVNYEIQAPRRLNILCQSDYGSLTTTNLQGTVKGKTGTGAIKAEQIEGPVDLDTSYGSIECKVIAGPTALLHSGTGAITATDLKGEAKITTSYGSITCNTFSGTTLDLTSGSGRIAISNASCRSCLANTSYGSIAADHLQGDAAKLHSGSGSLDLTAVNSPDLDLATSYGHIRAQEITTAKLLAHSGSGGVNIVCAPASPADLNADVKSSYGSIDFTAPSTFSGQVDLRTDYGSIRTTLPITVSGEISKTKITGQIGAGTGQLRLQTGSGSISLK